MNSITSHFFLDTRRQKKDGQYPIKLRITINRQSFEMSMGQTVPIKDWNEKSSRVRTGSKEVGNVTRFNNYLQKKKSEAIETIMQLEDDGLLLSMSMKEVRNRIKGGNNAGDTYAFFEEVIAQMNSAGQVGNARVYQMVYNSIKKFGGKQDFPLRQITFRWLKKYESWYLSRTARTGKPNSVNGLAVNLRTLRALMNRAIKSNLLAQEDYPFRNYQIQRKKTRNRAIGPEDIRKIADVDEGTLTIRQKRAKTYFLVSFYLMGISFVDLAFLKVRNIIKGRVDYKRRKTGRQHSIKITEPLLKLLEPHLEGKKQNDFIFNIVKGETEEDRYTAIRTELKRYNTALKQIGQTVGVEMNLTSYIARHSYASIAKMKGVPIAVISEALGHENVEVTQVYLNSFDTEVLDGYNEMIVSL